jgi:L-amino acid N-acyltransferase YncA
VRDGGACELWTAERLARWRQDRPDLPTQFHQDRIDGVDLCAVAVEDGVVLGLIWIYRPEHYSRMFRLRPGEVELNQGFVLPQHRKRGLFTGVLDFACVEMARRGFHTAYAAVHEANGPSLGAFTGAGFLPRGAIRHVFLFRPAVSPPPLPDQDPTVAIPAA